MVGVQPEASAAMHAYLAAGRWRLVPSEPTLADGVAGNIERGAITLRLARRLVDDVVLVGEEPIAAAMRWVASELHQRIEGAGALGIAALQQGRLGSLAGRRVAVVVSGGNVDQAIYDGAISGSSMSR
jgi:threonine dehydratase